MRMGGVVETSATPASRLLVYCPEGLCGRLSRPGPYLFAFDPAATPAHAPSLSMPLRERPFEHDVLHPVFHMNLPEGFILEQLRHRLSKTSGLDPLLMLSVIGSQAPIGRLRYGLDGVANAAALEPGAGERLADLLAHRGSRDLFARLVDTYLMRSGISGVQPKVLVPQIQDDVAQPRRIEPGKAALPTNDLIVKSGLDDFPGLAINEFICMSIVRRAGIPVPEFFLSDDGELFIMRRFDRPEDGRILGFEDVLALAGRNADAKYDGSYEQVLRILRLYCAPELHDALRHQFFDMVALSCLLGNGDAHMKNFGVLYANIGSPVRMAPAYDIVCTRMYLPEDSLALNLAGQRSFFSARQGLIEFGEACGFSRPRVFARLCALARLCLESLEDMAEHVSRLPGFRDIVQREALLYLKTFDR